MKKFWKALGIAALAAAVPVQIFKDKETGTRSYRSLLLEWKSIDKGEKSKEINISLMDGILTAPIYDLLTSKKETVLFADDEPEAATVPEVIDFAAAAAEKAVEKEPQAGEEEVQTSAEEATEEDFDPEI